MADITWNDVKTPTQTAEQVQKVRINFYKNTAEPNRLDKRNYLYNIDYSSTGVNSDSYVLGTFRDRVDFTYPVFIVSYGTEIFCYNYIRVHIGKINSSSTNMYKYYFINNIVALGNNLYELHCSVDVLMTYRNIIILLGVGFVDRNEYEYNEMIPDDKRVITYGYTKEEHTLGNDVICNPTGEGDDNKDGIYSVSAFAMKPDIQT